MTETFLAEAAIEVGHHETANWFGLTVNTDTVLATVIAAVIVIGLAFFLRAKVTSTGVPGGVQLFWEAITVQLRDQIEAAIGGNVGDIYAAFLQGFRDFFAESAADPLVISLLTGTTKPDLLQLITTDSAPIITRCSARLTESFMHSWVRASEEDSGVLARAIVRLAMSYVSMPPEANHDVARDLARLMTPFAERYGAIEQT